MSNVAPTVGSSPSAAALKSRRRTMVASTVGTVLEWYDFNLYGLASALIFGPLFFGSSSLGATLASFATFAVGFAARPIGGIILGNLGDRIGRKKVLILTFIIMGISSALIGCLPTVDAVGILAPILLIVLRVAQGFAVGGEFAGATLLTIENAPAGKRGLYGAIPSMGTGAGFVLASLTFAGISLLPKEDFIGWGWRLPFLFSIVLVIFGVIVRRKIDETPVFQELATQGKIKREPLWAVFRKQPVAVIRTMGVTISGFVWGYLIQAFALSYATKQLGIDSSVMLWAIAIASTLEIASIPFWGWMSDKIGRKRMVISGLIFTAAYVFPFFMLLETRSTPLIFLAMIIAIPIAKDSVFGPQAALVAEMFDSRVRYSGVSAGREIGGAVFGGTAPFIGTALVAVAGGFWPVALYVIVACSLTGWATLSGKETSTQDIRSSGNHAAN
ncbi:MFS transporter [Paenarthrobacter sp. A20]|uniref:MFS transporter n=1 Tax=Paenarthrobacter sp. A20 TaxID=2817891 RepID=UPI00209F7250|nr:MFS transporter [Paenarthrobacter sp. A20]MCP1415739.1 MHS family shikimate/dehydroshikimate transporter-like MFS transporter [Paenarthrobacter sp. A20]